MLRSPLLLGFSYLSVMMSVFCWARPALSISDSIVEKSYKYLWSNEYLCQLDTVESRLHESLAHKLAIKARSYSRLNGRRSRGKCMRGVRIALYRALLATDTLRNLSIFVNLNGLPNDPGNKRRYRPGRSAHDFAHWAQANPKTMCRALGLAELTNKAGNLYLKRGMILVYRAGTCGFNKRFGHIEVVTDSLKREVCSDHCRIARAQCIPDMILAPVKACSMPLFSIKNSESTRKIM